MRKLTIRETRASLSKLDELLSREKELIVTRRGKPVAKIVPLQTPEVPTHADLRNETALLTRSSAELLREDRDRL